MSRTQPEEPPPVSAVAVGPTTRSLSRADTALVFAVIAPAAIMGLLVLTGVGVGVAVCITFIVALAVTTTLDVIRFLRRRRLRTDRSRSLE